MSISLDSPFWVAKGIAVAFALSGTCTAQRPHKSALTAALESGLHTGLNGGQRVSPDEAKHLHEHLP